MAWSWRWWVAAVVAVVTFAPKDARGDDSPSRERVGYAYIAAGWNPPVLGTVAGVFTRWNRPHDANPLLDGRYLEAGAEVGLNPSYGSLAFHVECVPTAILQLRAEVDLYGYTGAFGALLGFQSARVPYGDDVRDARSGTEVATWAYRVSVQPTLRFQIGSLILRDQLDLAYYRAIGIAAPYVLQIDYDLLTATADVLVLNRAEILGDLWHGAGEASLVAGAYHEYAAALGSGQRHQRVGVLWQLIFANRLGPVARPRVLGALGVAIEDRNREGGVFVVVAVGGEFDLGDAR